jgi:hypothetical protein
MHKSPGRVEPTSPRMESPDLKNLRKRDVVQELGKKAYRLSPSSIQHYHPYLAKCDSMLEKVIHRISEFYLKNVAKPQDDS